MSITLPFLKLPVLLQGEADEHGKYHPKIVEARIQPADISTYNEGYYFGTLIYMNSGNVYMTELNVDVIDYNIAKYWENVEKMDKAAGKSKIFSITD